MSDLQKLLQDVAGSQYVWTIVALLLGASVFKYMRDDGVRRENRLVELYEKQRKESITRENRLMAHLDKTTDVLAHMDRRLARVENKLDIDAEVTGRAEQK